MKKKKIICEYCGKKEECVVYGKGVVENSQYFLCMNYVNGDE